jgi:GGDEF domain-containing protein
MKRPDQEATIDTSFIPNAILDMRSPEQQQRSDSLTRLANFLIEIAADYDACVQVSNTLEVGFADPLTKLPNKAFLKSELEKKLANTETARSSALALFDIVGFAAVNEAFGHDVGDSTLKGFAQSLKDSVRTTIYLGPDRQRDIDLVTSMSDRVPGNIASRFGGDEFAVIFNGIDRQNPIDTRDFIAKKSMKLLLGLKSMMAANGMNEFGVYANMALVDPTKYQTYSQLVRAADPKLKDKEHRNRVEIIMQVENGVHYFYDNIHRCYIE